MSRARIVVLTSLAMLAFAGNSLLCRIALKQTGIDAASFTTIRLLSGALMLGLLVRLNRRPSAGGGNWPSALALFVYAAGFSFAYVRLSAATGALLLFAAVQATMITYGVCKGERLRRLQLVGLVLALSALLMLGAGAAWGIYSLRGKGVGDPIAVTAGNFVRSVPIAVALSLLMLNHVSSDRVGMAYAVLSGALASGIGYAIWYRVLPAMKATHAATVQLSVPVIAALGGIVMLGESISVRAVLASTAILGGIALVILEKQAVKKL